MAQLERSSKELLERKMIEVKIENDKKHRMKDDALKTYEDRITHLQHSADTISKRMSVGSSSCRNPVSGKADDRQGGERKDSDSNQSVQLELASILASCEFWISQISER